MAGGERVLAGDSGTLWGDDELFFLRRTRAQQSRNQALRPKTK